MNQAAPKSETTRSRADKTPDELIAEFHARYGFTPGNVTYENGLIVFRYPNTRMPEDRLTLARFQEIINERRKRVSGTR